MGTQLRVTIGQHSQAGRKSINQDFHGARIPGRPLLDTKGIAVALADGISSSAVSQVASAAAVHGFLDDYFSTSDAWTVRRAAERVLSASNSWLHAQNRRTAARFEPDSGYVCTFSALVFKGTQVHLLHVGDARIMRLHAHALEPLSHDHRVRVSSAESYLAKALGAGPSVEIDYDHWPAEVGDTYVLATDGAYEYLDAADIHAALQGCSGDWDTAARQLTDLALARGSADNVTLQLVRVDELPDAHDPPWQQLRSPLVLPPALQPRDTFEHYTILRTLHTSSRSHVYLAQDTQTRQLIVLKTPSVDLRGDPDYLDQFVLEEWIARRVDSPHVVRAGPDTLPRRHLYVALEYIEGQTLAQWMRDHPAPELTQVRHIVEQIAAGLQAFHRKEMLHQDLRPENVMIDAAGTVKIIDLASTHVAGLLEGTPDALPLRLRGTLQYTAPEYFVGAGGGVPSEVFSLAVLTYHMLTGQLPYGLQVTRVKSTDDLRRLRYVPIRQLRPDLPTWLDAVLQRALHPQADKRQAAVSEWVHDLRHPGAQYLAYRAPPLIERDPVTFWKALTLLLALALCVDGAWQVLR